MSDKWINGLPSAGDSCEYQHEDNDPVKDHWFRCKANYRYGDRDSVVIVAFCDHLECEQGLDADDWKFRPIKPPIDIEREKRGEAIEAMAKIYNNNSLLSVKQRMARIYDSGYKEQVEVVSYGQARSEWAGSQTPLLETFYKENYLITRKEEAY
jgi:ATP-dependent Zn protease